MIEEIKKIKEIKETENKSVKKNISRENLLKIKKKYKRYFLGNAFILCLYQIKYRILSGVADYIFSGEKQKPTRFLRIINKFVNKNICKCQRTAEKCEYYKLKIEKIEVTDVI